jgi:CubicO group peptidase (beta-lactamase class C family)
MRFRDMVMWLLIMLLWGCAGAAGAGSDPAAPAAAVSTVLDSFPQAQVDAYGLAGFGACIVKNGAVAWKGAAGWSDMERKRPVTGETIFGVGSVSKVVTLAAFMSLWEKGLCSLDDDVSRYLSFPVRNPRHPEKPITIRMLLSFTAGIFDVDFQVGKNRLDFLSTTEDSPVKAEQVLADFLVPGGKYYTEENYLESAPGERYAYSNSSYSLIGCLVERLSGRPFFDYCREAVFDPLRMKDTTWRLSDLDRARYAYTYHRESGTWSKEEPSTWPGYMDGGLRTTLADMGNFLVMMANRGEFEGRRVLKPATVDTMLTLHNPPGAPAGRGFPTIGRGFVWVLSDVQGRRIFQMNGYGPSFFAQVFFDPAQKSGGAFFTTGGFESFGALGKAVQESVSRLIEASDRF